MPTFDTPTVIGNRAEHAKPRFVATALNESALIAAILAVTASVYAATLRFPFVYDDHGQIVDNVLIQAWRYVPQYFRGQVWQYLFPYAVGNYYRPLNLLWFRVNYALFHLRPQGWHTAAILLHVLATYLAYRLARRLTNRPLVASAAALIFGIHPMHHGVVAWVSGTTESLWAVFFLAAFLAYLYSRDGARLRWMAASCGFYALALFSKETAIMLPVLVGAHIAIYGEPHNSWTQSLSRRVLSGAKFALTYMPLVIVYVLTRVSVLQGFAHERTNVSLRTLLWTFPSVVWFYVRQWLLPIHFSEFYDLRLQSTFDFAHVLVPALAIIAIGALLWWCRSKLGPQEVAFAVAWIVVPLLPVFDLAIFPSGDLVHDRYFYVPSFGAALLLGLALEKLVAGPRMIGVPQKWLLAMLLLTIPLAYAAANASSYWIDDYVLFQHAYAFAPANSVVRNNYAIELSRKGGNFEAIPILRALLRDEPDNWLANYNLARLSYEQRSFADADTYFSRAIQLNPQDPDGYFQRGLLELRIDRLSQAEADMRQAIALKPVEPTFHFGLGVVLVQQGNCTEALSQFATTLALKPSFSQAKQEGALCRDKTGAQAN